MKRVFPFISALIILFASFAFPVYAADEYHFTFDEAQSAFLMTGYIPEGDYVLYADAYLEDSVFPISSAPFSVKYSDWSLDNNGVIDSAMFESGDVSVSFHGSLYSGFSFILLHVFDEDLTCFGFKPLVDFNYDIEPSDIRDLRLVSYSGTSLSTVVDGDLMSGVLDQVVVLLPIVLGVLVAYIAIRKGISFLRDFLARS